MIGMQAPPVSPHMKPVWQALNRQTNFQHSPLYWSGEPSYGLPVRWSPKTINDISLKAHGNIGENFYNGIPAANSLGFLYFKNRRGVNPSPGYGYTSGIGIPALFAPTSPTNQYGGRTNI